MASVPALVSTSVPSRLFQYQPEGCEPVIAKTLRNSQIACRVGMLQGMCFCRYEKGHAAQEAVGYQMLGFRSLELAARIQPAQVTFRFILMHVANLGILQIQRSAGYTQTKQEDPHPLGNCGIMQLRFCFRLKV